VLAVLVGEGELARRVAQRVGGRLPLSDHEAPAI
jgi:hypothetical protein